MIIAPDNLLLVLLIGALVGAIASRVVMGHGFGCLANTAVGVAGGFIGGIIVAHLLPSATVINHPLLDYTVTAFLGAVVLVLVLRLFARRRGRRGRSGW